MCTPRKFIYIYINIYIHPENNVIIIITITIRKDGLEEGAPKKLENIRQETCIYA